MPNTPVLILRFPDGDVEYRSTRGKLPIGARVRARGCEWRVKAYRNEAVMLEPVDSACDGAPAGPLVLPNPLGDTPLTLEVMSEV